MKPVPIIFLVIATLVIRPVPSAEATQRDPTCYIDLHGIFKAADNAHGFYVGMLGSGIGVGFVVWGSRSHKKATVAAGVGVIAAGSALAVHYAR